MYDLVPPDFLDIPPREILESSNEMENIEIGRGPIEEFGVRANSNSPMPGGRSRTDTMVRAEGFILGNEEFEEHIPPPETEEMENVELPASFYHERMPSPPIEHHHLELAPEPVLEPRAHFQDIESHAEPGSTTVYESQQENITAKEPDFPVSQPEVVLEQVESHTTSAAPEEPSPISLEKEEEVPPKKHEAVAQDPLDEETPSSEDSKEASHVDEPRETSAELEPPLGDIFVSIPNAAEQSAEIEDASPEHHEQDTKGKDDDSKEEKQETQEESLVELAAGKVEETAGDQTVVHDERNISTENHEISP